MSSPVIDFDELKAMLAAVETNGVLDGPTATRLIREHARISALHHELIWANLVGCRSHRRYRGTTKKPPQTGCDQCRQLWEFHQEVLTTSFDEKMHRQTRLVAALLAREGVALLSPQEPQA